jgi:hypothetical protein
VWRRSDLKTPVSISIDKETLNAIKQHPLTKDIGRSAVCRVALSEFLEKGKLEKKERENEKKEE